MYPGVGGHAITAVYNGDANFTSSTSPIFTQTVNQGATSTVVTSSVDPSVSGQNVTYTATVAALAPASGTPSGTVAFMDGATTLSGCVAQPLVGGAAACSIAYPGVGSHAITAVYSGELNFIASTSSILTQTVSPATTSTAVASSVNPSVTGQSVTVTATVSIVAPGSGAATGTVAFLDNGSTIAGCAAQVVSGTGTATCDDTFVSAGAEIITAVYSGDADFLNSTSAALTQTINPGATATALTSSDNPSVSGESVSYTAIVTAVAPAAGTPTGNLAFFDGASAIAGCGAQPLVGGVASCDVVYAGVGSHAITAVYSGDANFAASTSPVLTQTIGPATTSTSLASSLNPSVTGQPVAITAAVNVTAPGSGIPTGTVTFMDGGVPIATCAAATVTGAGMATCPASFDTAGAHAITAAYSGDSHFTASTSSAVTQTTSPGATAAMIVSSSDPSVAGQAVSYVATVSAVAPASGIPTGTVAFLDGASTVTACATQALVAGMASCTVTYSIAGSHLITAVYSGDTNFAGSTSAPLNQDVALVESVTTVASPASTWGIGQVESFTATVAPASRAQFTPTGTAAFMDAGAPVPGCAAQPVVSGTASCQVAFTGTGTYPITAVYSGDAALTASTSPTFMLSVYDDPPAPGAGAHSALSTSWGYFAILGSVFLVFLAGYARLRRKDI